MSAKKDIPKKDTDKKDTDKKDTDKKDTDKKYTDKKGYIYLRDNPWYQEEAVVKMGISSSLMDRDATYTTGEVYHGDYIAVYEIPLYKMRLLDNTLKAHFAKHSTYKGGGTEFYARYIASLLPEYLRTLNVEWRAVPREELALMNRTIRMRSMPGYDKLKQLIRRRGVAKITENYKKAREVIASSHQQEVLDRVRDFYTTHSIGKCIWACGLGKTLLSIMIVKLLGFKSVIFGTPSNNLQMQIYKEIIKIYPDKSRILLVGEGDGTLPSTTDKKDIDAFIASHTGASVSANVDAGPFFIIATYHSCHLLTKAAVDFKIGDEAHHLAATASIADEESARRFTAFHNIKAVKTLFMTATEKIIKSNTAYYSMDDESVFGKYIDVKSVYWAIENKKITDYYVLILKNTKRELDQILSRVHIAASANSESLTIDYDIFIACYMCMRSLEKYRVAGNSLTHILLYTNTTEKAELAQSYIAALLSSSVFAGVFGLVYNKALHSKNCKNLSAEVEQFRTAPCGIISCVYIFGEGFDLPTLNGVCIAGNMQSEIRIVQYLLRPNRLDKNKPDKRAYCIIPYIDDEYDSSLSVLEAAGSLCSSNYEKLRNVISQMRSVDKTVEQKIVLYDTAASSDTADSGTATYTGPQTPTLQLRENTAELEKIKMRLILSRALNSKFNDALDEYAYVKYLNKGLKLTSKKEYAESKDRHPYYIDDAEIYFRGRGAWTSWYDFLQTDTSRYLDKPEWRQFCLGLRIACVEDYHEASKKYDCLPKEPAEYYTGFTNLAYELGFGRRR